ncbi:MAG: molybdate ABC transporter substrate-binding protein [Isosphaeraceae bacterium]|nr:molybdate ABC transporter substrate-binding protein [Isosphaeraceae bacterium]
MNRVATWLGSMSVVLSALGCGGSPTVPANVAAPKPKLHIAAASDLQVALPVLAERFTKRTGTEVSLTFDASGRLARQIKEGAPYDVFLAANRSFVQGLADDGLVQPNSVHPYALGSLVLAIYPEVAGAVQSIADLSLPEVKKIALANPATAPYGAAGKQALERAGLWAKLEPRIVQSDSVRQALQFVETGNAEAGLVGKSGALASKKIQVVDVDKGLYDPIVQALGIVARTKLSSDAQRFCEFMLSQEGQAGLLEFGFEKADGVANKSQ